MSKQRNDMWTQEHDDILITAILDGVRKGTTKTVVFKNVAIQLQRTSAACGFRWNSVLSKQMKEDVSEARMDRLKNTEYSNLVSRKNKLDNVYLTSESEVFIEIKQDSQGKTNITILDDKPTIEYALNNKVYVLSKGTQLVLN